MATRSATATKKSDVDSVLAELERLGTKKTKDAMARYGIPSANALGVRMGDLQKVAKRVGKDHALAAALWKTGCYEARMVTCYVGEPAKLTSAQMDRWTRDCDNWAHVDTLAFALFDKSPHAPSRIAAWATSEREFVKRMAFALIASVALHDKKSGDESFTGYLPIIEAGADDERNFVKKGVSWALRSLGRRSAKLHAACVALAKRLAASEHAGARFVGKDAFRELTSPKVAARFAKKR